MDFFTIIGGFLLFHVAFSDAAKYLPAGLHEIRCKENDVTTMECLKVATQKAVTLLRNGVPSLGVLPLDPLFVSEMTIAQDANSPVSINLHFTNETIIGFGEMVINSVRGSSKLDNYHLIFNVMIPNFQMIGHYVIDGKVLVLPIRGSGFSNMTLVKLDVQADIMGKEIIKKGEKYIEITDFKLDIEPERLYMQFDNLFNGDPALGNHMNNFLNENWSIIYKELKPSIGDTFEAIFKEISNRIYGRVPFKNIVQ